MQFYGFKGSKMIKKKRNLIFIFLIFILSCEEEVEPDPDQQNGSQSTCVAELGDV